MTDVLRVVVSLAGADDKTWTDQEARVPASAPVEKSVSRLCGGNPLS